MEEIITKIDALAKQMNERFETVDNRLDKMDGRLDKMNERFETVETRLGNLEQGQAAIREDIKNSNDTFRLFELKVDRQFKSIETSIIGLKEQLFIEEGSREHADTVAWDTQDEKWRTQDKKWQALDKRLHVLEAHLGLE